jgi:S-disulfanyl-L-cysteine oxidoreductase SoxD
MWSWRSGETVVIHSGLHWVFDVPPPARALAGAALLAMIASTGRGDPPALEAHDGGKLYAQQCAECHGATLGGGKGPPLRGADFLQSWQHKTARNLYSRILTTMPAAAPGTLPAEAVLDLTIYILIENGVDVGPPLKTSADPLNTIEIK